ncbi:MAG: hypothetical protein ACOYY2_14285 [Actinomycetota bacterium]
MNPLTPSLDRAADLLTAGLRTGRDLVGGLLGTLGNAPRPGGGCAVPDPCWLPERLPEVRSQACPGATARLRLRVENGGPRPRRVSVAARGPGAAAVTVQPPTLDLDPFEEGQVEATVPVPAEGAGPVDTWLWVSGCRDHVLRWRVSVSDRGASSLHEVRVVDAPDLVHHWYDHFACDRPCPSGGPPTRG